MKRFFFALAFAALLLLLWYLFVRPFEFGVSFRANTTPGDIIETIRIWDRSLANASVRSVDSTYGVKQRISVDKRAYVYDWRFDVVDDTATKVTIRISEPGNSIVNKILIPFTEQPIEADAHDIAHKFYKILQQHLEITKVRVLGEDKTEEKFCVCRNIETKQTDKANGMMMDYGLLSSFVADHSLVADGLPIVRLTRWNHNEGTLSFDFCFPIKKDQPVPDSEFVTYKQLPGVKAIRAIYNGNYITSDRAWYALTRYAAVNGYKVNGLPVEIFHNNPNLGQNEKEWRADIFLPVE